jgi:polyisoprenoid-binding protein YceI
MNRGRILLGAVTLVLVVGLVAVGPWNWLLGPTLEASGPITAEPLTVPASSDAQLTVLHISQAASEVRFVLSEELRGEPTTVVGSSNQVAGEIAVDPNDLSTAQVGVIQINARTLATNQDRRNQAIRNQILDTDAYEFITFTPTEIRGLDGSAAAEAVFTFQIVGDLTIRDVTLPVVFDVTATVDSMGQVSGAAVAVIERSDYGLVIPSVPLVANVSEAVQLEIDFVAVAS